MRRGLGGFESAEAWTGASFAYNAVTALRLSGPLPEERLAAALAELQRRHPLLGARLERAAGRWFFATAPGEVPLGRVERRGEESWRAVAEDELSTPMDWSRAPLVRCRLVASADGGEACELVLAFHHAVVDAVAAATVCRELLALSGGIPPEEEGVAGSAAGAVGGLPPAPDDRFPPRYRGLSRWPALAGFAARRLAEEAAYLWRSRGLRSPAPPATARCRLLTVELGEAATRALVRRCRRRRVPLNSALNAALLLAVQRHRYGGRTVPLRYFAFADLRPHLAPPASPRTVASYLTTMRFTLTVGAGEGFWRLAERINRQLLGSFRRGERFLFCLTAAPLLRALLRVGRLRFGSAALSYTGPLDFPERFGPLEVRGLHAFVSNMPVGAEVTAQARLYRRRLWWDFVTLDADLDEAGARTVATDILGRLEEAGGADE